MTQQSMDTRSTTNDPQASKLANTVRHNAIGGSIWRQQGKNGEFYNFTLSRSFKSKETGETGYSPNFNERNAEDLIATIKDCVNWIREKTAEGQS